MILIALGSNMGDRESTLRAALFELEAAGVRTLAQSAILETPALLPPDAPADWNRPFLNQVIVVETAHPPKSLLGIMKSVELQLGRVNRGHWGPREIDLDLLAYGEQVLDGELMVPHPRLQERAFVLTPLAEVAPHWRHPVLKQTAAEMLAALAA